MRGGVWAVVRNSTLDGTEVPGRWGIWQMIWAPASRTPLVPGHPRTWAALDGSAMTVIRWPSAVHCPFAGCVSSQAGSAGDHLLHSFPPSVQGISSSSKGTTTGSY